MAVVASVVGALGGAACAHRGLCVIIRDGPFLAKTPAPRPNAESGRLWVGGLPS